MSLLTTSILATIFVGGILLFCHWVLMLPGVAGPDVEIENDFTACD